MMRLAPFLLFLAKTDALSQTRVNICKTFYYSLSPVDGFSAPTECANLCGVYADSQSCVDAPNLATCVARNDFGCASLASRHQVRTWTPDVVEGDMNIMICEGIFNGLAPKTNMPTPEECAKHCAVFAAQPLTCKNSPNVATCVTRKVFGCASLASANKVKISGHDDLSLSQSIESLRVLSVCRKHFQGANLPACAAHCLNPKCPGGNLKQCVINDFPECNVSPAMKSAKSSTSRITQLLPESAFTALFPQLSAGRDWNCDGYLSFTYAGLVESADRFPEFINSGNEEQDRRELAAFLAQCSHETTGGTQGNPDANTWGLCFREEVGCGPDRCPAYGVAESGASFHGRGGFQLSYEYNYLGFSQFYYGDDRLFKAPEKLLLDSAALWASAIWFWMTPQAPKISCHEALKASTVPSPDDAERNRKPGFGWTTNIINGGVECGPRSAIVAQEQDRIDFFVHYCDEMGVCPGANLECWQQQQYGW